MEPEKIEKKIRDAKGVAIVILVINIILFGVTIFFGELSTAAILIRCLVFAVIVATILGYSKRTMLGPVCGIIVSILIILNLDIIDIIIGILYLVDNITLIKYIKE